MSWAHDIAYVFGGLFLANALPHWVGGLMGRPFQSPFAKPSGVGLSSSTVNVLWGLFNLAMAWLLIAKVGAFDIRSPEQAGSVGAGMLLISLFAARHFGRFHGGVLTEKP